MKFLIYGKGWISEHIQVILENSGDAFFIGNRVNNFQSTLREVYCFYKKDILQTVSYAV